MRRAILTGGNGFVGSHLVETLVADGVEVHAVANEAHQRLNTLLPPERIHVIRQSPYAAAELVTRIEPDAIFHLAAVYEEPVSIECVQEMVDGNLALGTALLFGASRCPKPAVFINTGTYWQFDAGGRYAPNTVYAATKQAFQDLLFFYERKGFVSAVTLILYDTFGRGDTRSKLWAHLLSLPPGTTVDLSDGRQAIELVAIEDVVQAFLHAARLLSSGAALAPVYCVRSETRATLKPMVEELNRRAHLELDLRWGAKPYWEGQVIEPWIGPQLPGWSPRISPIDALVALALGRAPTPAPGTGLGPDPDPDPTSRTASQGVPV